jgi:chorismate synthase
LTRRKRPETRWAAGVEVIATGVPIGLGSYVQWDRKLDGRLAHALMSIPAIKAVGVGIGPEAAARPGSRVHDEIVLDTSGGVHAVRPPHQQRRRSRGRLSPTARTSACRPG